MIRGCTARFIDVPSWEISIALLYDCDGKSSAESTRNGWITILAWTAYVVHLSRLNDTLSSLFFTVAFLCDSFRRTLQAGESDRTQTSSRSQCCYVAAFRFSGKSIIGNFVRPGVDSLSGSAVQFYVRYSLRLIAYDLSFDGGYLFVCRDTADIKAVRCSAFEWCISKELASRGSLIKTSANNEILTSVVCFCSIC